MNGIIYKGNVKCTEAELIAAYKEYQSVWKVADRFGMSGQSVYKHLKTLGIVNKLRVFSEAEIKILKERYLEYRNTGRLRELAAELGRTKQFICRQAGKIGLTDLENKISMKPFAEDISKRSKAWIAERGHPRGMLGKTHSDEFKLRMSKISKATWADPNSKLNSDEHRQSLSDRMMKYKATAPKDSNNYSRVKHGTCTIGGKTFFARSSWEANIAAYFEFLKQNNEIADWQHEPETFWFEKIKRGIRSYLPDFKITNKDGSFYFVEVKGWMDKKSVTKIKRMGIYYPAVKLDVIGEKRYKSIATNRAVIPNWGMLDSESFLPSP